MTSAISGYSQNFAPEISGMRARREKEMQPVADLLKMSTSDLKDALKSGKTLKDIAADNGVSQDDLVAAIAKGLKDNAPADTPSDIDFTQMATDIANGIHGHRGHGGPPPRGVHDRMSSNGDNEAESTIEDLAKSLGIDKSKLLDLLQDVAKSRSSQSTDIQLSELGDNDPAKLLQSLIAQRGSKGLTYNCGL